MGMVIKNWGEPKVRPVNPPNQGVNRSEIFAVK